MLMRKTRSTWLFALCTLAACVDADVESARETGQQSGGICSTEAVAACQASCVAHADSQCAVTATATCQARVDAECRSEAHEHCTVNVKAHCDAVARAKAVASCTATAGGGSGRAITVQGNCPHMRGEDVSACPNIDPNVPGSACSCPDLTSADLCSDTVSCAVEVYSESFAPCQADAQGSCEADAYAACQVQASSECTATAEKSCTAEATASCTAQCSSLDAEAVTRALVNGSQSIGALRGGGGVDGAVVGTQTLP